MRMTIKRCCVLAIALTVGYMPRLEAQLSSSTLSSTAATSPSSVYETDTKQAFVQPIDDILVPAEAAGKILELPVREGEMVTEGMVLGRLSVKEALSNYKVAFNEHAAAKKEAENDIKVRAAQAAELVKQAEVDSAEEANRDEAGAVTEMELNRLRLDAKHAKLQTEQSELQFVIAAMTAEVQEGKMELAVYEYRKRQMKSPFTGMVVKFEKHVGEWVNVGEPVMRLLRLDRLYVRQVVNQEDLAPHLALHRPVEIEVAVGGEKQSIQSTISYVEPEIQPDGRFTVRAEIENRQVGDTWLIWPGMRVQMTILAP